MSMLVAAIILAAGASRRLGQPKQLLVHRGETLIQRAIRLAQEAGASPVFVVLGAHFDVIRASVPPRTAIIVHNDQWERGIASSIHAGLHAMETCAPDSSGVMLMSCDQPHLTAEHLRSLIIFFSAHLAENIVASSYNGVRGIPAIVPRGTFSALLALRGDKGARSLIANSPCAVVTVDLVGGEVDIDSPDDLVQLE